MPGEGHGTDAAATGAAWGVWESAATTVLFSSPAFLLFWKVRADPGGPSPEPAFDGVDWLVVGAALAGGIALSLAAGGLRSARLYVTTGLSSCFVWLLLGLAFPSTALLVGVYRPLVFANLAAHFNLLPLVLVNAAVRSRASLPDDVMSRLRQRMWAVGGAVAGLDVSPLVWLLAPSDWSRPVAFGWAGACIAVGGMLAALVATDIAAHSHPSHMEDGRAPSRP